MVTVAPVPPVGATDVAAAALVVEGDVVLVSVDDSSFEQRAATARIATAQTTLNIRTLIGLPSRRRPSGPSPTTLTCRKPEQKSVEMAGRQNIDHRPRRAWRDRIRCPLSSRYIG